MATEYTLPLDGDQASSLSAIAQVLRANAGLFKSLVICYCGADVQFQHPDPAQELL